ncbi:hypothetical protein QTN47_22165 [Danxiaibacter flavus]|uniref:Uncharacterized protein n=1 Tax=Danxiaibacter flavus TaxID=3049108 RepID=A0ABV3ZK27_9BACT|nr:hypothetical protein QNM32_22170 [Chitinophagaceae bacterium DXS]
MIEVFKTNVINRTDADRLIEAIHKLYTEHKATFDLEDCDKILRVKSIGDVYADDIIELVKDFGFNAEVLPDELAPARSYFYYAGL